MIVLTNHKLNSLPVKYVDVSQRIQFVQLSCVDTYSVLNVLKLSRKTLILLNAHLSNANEQFHIKTCLHSKVFSEICISQSGYSVQMKIVEKFSAWQILVIM